MVLSMGKCLMCQKKNSLCEKTLRAQGVCLFGEFMCRGKGAVRADVPPRFCASKIFRSPTPHPHKHLHQHLLATYPDPHPQRSLGLTPTLTSPQAFTSFSPKVTSLVTIMMIESRVWHLVSRLLGIETFLNFSRVSVSVSKILVSKKSLGIGLENI